MLTELMSVCVVCVWNHKADRPSRPQIQAFPWLCCIPLMLLQFLKQKKISRENKEHDATFVCCADLMQIIKGKQGLVLPQRGSNLDTFDTTWQ